MKLLSSTLWMAGVLACAPWAQAAELSPAAPAATQSPAPTPAKKEGGDVRLLQADTDLIDIPTASILDYGSFSTRTRFFSNGGALEWLSFGVFQRLNIGASLNIDKLLGTGSPVQVTRPDLQIKFRFYDGTPIFPALAVGFDDQGYLYNRQSHSYNQRDHGLYLVGSQEVLFPGLQFHGGMNIPDFDSNPLFGFIGADFNIADRALIMAEWDSINNIDDSRLNIGLRAYLTPNFHLDFSLRSIGQGGHFSDGLARGSERVVNFKYIANF